MQLTDAQKEWAELVFLPMYYQHIPLILAQAAGMGTRPSGSAWTAWLAF